MTAHTRIAAAENAIATAYTNASWRDADHTHEAAVELESRGLLVDRAAVDREVRQQLAAEIADVRTKNWFESPHDAVAEARREGLLQALRIVLGEDPPKPVDVDGSPSDLPENMQTIPAGSTVRRMRFEPNSGEPYRAVTVDVPDGTTVELWVDPLVAPVLAAQLADAPVSLRADMRGGYGPFAEGSLTGLQEAGLECARCGRYVEDAAVATRLVGYTSDLDSTVVACHPRCGSSPWDVEQLRWLLSMPDVESVVDGSPGDLFDPTGPAGDS